MEILDILHEVVMMVFIDDGIEVQPEVGQAAGVED